MRKTILLGIMTILALSIVFALDADTPYTVTMNWIVPSDTTFTVSLPDGESTIDFNPASGTEDYVQPDGQNNDTGEPVINITNAGNVNLNFTNNLTASKPAFATLMSNNDPNHLNSTAFDTTAVLIEEDVAPAAVVAVYLWTNITDATGGTTARTYQINSIDNS